MAPRRARPFPCSNARAEASRKNGAKSRGPKTPEGKARVGAKCAQARHARAEIRVLPQEDAAAFAALETAILAELAPVGVLQTLLARRVAVAAWRLERADRMEAEVLEFRSYEDANAGLALIRDGNATRSFDTLMRYRSAAMAEFWRALKTLKALQAEQAATQPHVRARAAPRHARARAPDRGAPPSSSREPNEPERLMAYLLPEPPIAGPALHEPAAPAMPNEPERHPARPAPAATKAAAPRSSWPPSACSRST